MSARTATVERKTKETQIKLILRLDGEGKTETATGVGFLDHMLELLGRHALLDLSVQAHGDTEVDDHHTVEDVGICVGQALREALGDKQGIRRFGYASVPMQEALANVALDLSGRPALVFNVDFPAQKVGSFDSELVEEFMEAFASNCMCNLHIQAPYGKNVHHMTEAIFKALARALRDAVSIDDRAQGVPSTKGVL